MNNRCRLGCLAWSSHIVIHVVAQLQFWYWGLWVQVSSKLVFSKKLLHRCRNSPIRTLRLTCSTGRYILRLAPSKWNCFLCLCAYMFSFQWQSWYFSFILSSAPMVMLMVHWSWVLGWNRLAYLYNCLVRVFFILYTLHQVHGNVLVDLGHPKWICLNKMMSICMLFMQ